MKHLFANKEDRDTAIEILENAKYLIEDDNQEFVCWAIEASANTGTWSRVIGKALMDEIRQRLRGVSAVSSWLYRYGGVDHDLITDSNMRAYRMRWIDSMIKELTF